MIFLRGGLGEAACCQSNTDHAQYIIESALNRRFSHPQPYTRHTFHSLSTFLYDIIRYDILSYILLYSLYYVTN